METYLYIDMESFVLFEMNANLDLQFSLCCF